MLSMVALDVRVRAPKQTEPRLHQVQPLTLPASSLFDRRDRPHPQPKPRSVSSRLPHVARSSRQHEGIKESQLMKTQPPGFSPPPIFQHLKHHKVRPVSQSPNHMDFSLDRLWIERVQL